jgi:hypothetical protein
MVDFPGPDPQKEAKLKELHYRILYSAVELNEAVSDPDIESLRDCLVRLSDAICQRALLLFDQDLANEINLSALRSGRLQIHDQHCFGLSGSELKEILRNRVERILAFEFEGIVRESIELLDLEAMGFDVEANS